MQDLRAENARLQRKVIELEGDLRRLESDNNFLKGEIKGVGHRKRDSTTDKINLAFERRLYIGRIYVDRVLLPSLGQVHTIIILAILYLVFGGKLP